MATSLADVTRHNDSALLLIAARVCRSLRKAVPGPAMHPNAGASSATSMLPLFSVSSLSTKPKNGRGSYTNIHTGQLQP